MVGGDQYTGMWERGKMAGNGAWVRPHRWPNQYTHMISPEHVSLPPWIRPMAQTAPGRVAAGGMEFSL